MTTAETPDPANDRTTNAAVPEDAAQDYLPPVVRPEPDTRLDQLVAEYASLKPLADEYKERLETIKNGIKTELRNLHPDREEIMLIGSTVPAPLRLTAVSKWQCDTKALKADKPDIWVRYAVQSTSWYLNQVKG